MTIWSYVLDTLISHRDSINASVLSEITTAKIVFIAGSVSLLFFGIGYMLYGLGSVAKPISDIIDELHDSNDSSSGSSTSDDNNDNISDNISDSDDSIYTNDTSETEDISESDSSTVVVMI